MVLMQADRGVCALGFHEGGLAEPSHCGLGACSDAHGVEVVPRQCEVGSNLSSNLRIGLEVGLQKDFGLLKCVWELSWIFVKNQTSCLLFKLF